MRGKQLSRVFRFSCRQMALQSSWRRLTAAVTALCLLVPAVVLAILAWRYEAPVAPEEAWQAPLCGARSILVSDGTEHPLTLSDWQTLQAYHPATWGEMAYTDGQVDETTLCLRLEGAAGAYRLELSVPEGSSLTEEDVAAYEAFLWDVFPRLLQRKAGLTAEQVSALHAPIRVVPRTDGTRELLGALVPYLCAMVVYFLVLFYGQGVAGSVVLEKSNKLMDFFLLTVPPVSLVLGKVLAGAAMALLQLGLWLVGLWGGFAAGKALAGVIAPEAEFGIFTVFEAVGEAGALFSGGAIVLSLLILLAGFLMYCALSGVGGALASKQEDLGSTNTLFSLVLVASFLVTILGGGGDGIIATDRWMDFVPFTAVLVTPSRLLLGEITLGQGCVSLAIVLLFALALCALAGKVYTMMSLYKGTPPTPARLVQMLRQR